MAIVDSGFRREYETGAVRDTAEGKGRCDLMPLYQVGDLLAGISDILYCLETFQRTGCTNHLKYAIAKTIDELYKGDAATAMLEVAKQFEEGASKYSERNWEKGIPYHCYLDSAIRHLIKWYRGDIDEPHDRAALWNLMCLWWTFDTLPEMNDLPYGRE